MDILVGLRTTDEVLLITSRSIARGVSVLKSDDTKVVPINKTTAIAFSGEPGDTLNFVEYIQANVRLHGFRHDIEMSPHAVASYSRKTLAESLRSRKPYQVNILVGGYDAHKAAPELHWIDYLGANVEQPYAAHGYASYYVLSTLDRHWHQNLDLEQGLKLAERCVNELQLRMPIDFKGCDVHIIDKNGIRKHESILGAVGDSNLLSEQAAVQA